MTGKQTKTTSSGHLAQPGIQSRNELRVLKAELARLNGELQAANRELRRLDEVRALFLSTAAHELFSPLTVFQGYVEMLLDGEGGALTKTQQEYLMLLQNATERLIETVNALLNANRLEAGRIELQNAPLDMTLLIEAAAQEIRPRFEAAGQKFSFYVAPDANWAWGDTYWVRQILYNLFSNAHKFMLAPGRITVEVQRADTDFLQVSVADTGVGITVEEQEKIFDLFYRSRAPVVQKQRGAGLGLYIACGLVELLGGRIWVQSTPGEGSTFFFTLPVPPSSN